jgi:ribosomal protein S6--L-glutamate ligase
MKIAFLMFRHPPTRRSPIMPEVVRLLTEWGEKVEVIYPEERMIDVSRVGVEHDLYVLKSTTELALSLAGALHAAGAALLNPYPITMMLRDKIITSHVLRRAGIPYPETFITVQPKHLAPLLDDGPLVLKPYQGSQGRGVHVVWDADQLNDVNHTGGLIFAQRYYRPQGRDLKLYVIGGQVMGVKRVWPAHTYEEKLGEPFTLTPEVHDIALSCGKAFGLELYGLDIILSAGRPYVVDMSSFPGFKGVPDAALRLADYIYTVGQRVRNGEPLLPEAIKEAVR